MPVAVLQALYRLNAAGYDAFVVGGAVRDTLLDRDPKDWDIASSASPSEIKRLFPDHTATGERFGTITVHLPSGPRDPIQPLISVEVTSFRAEADYVDSRHPSKVSFAADLATDLSRRDFTINAMAWHPAHGVIDPWGGQADLAHRRLTTVGDPMRRFREDPLRILRAARFASELDFRLPLSVKAAMRALSRHTELVSPERVQSEFSRMLVGVSPKYGLRLLRITGVLTSLLPELTASFALRQGRFHAYSVYTHSVVAMSYTPPKLTLRLAALLHDLGKTKTRTIDEDGGVYFHDHEQAGAAIARQILQRLRYPGWVIDDVVRLIKFHMFRWSPEQGLPPLRRLISQIGVENIRDLVALRRADLLAMRPAKPGDRRPQVIANLQEAVESVLKSGGALQIKDLAVNGADLMRSFALEPGPLVGQTLRHLFDAVLAEPSRNERSTLLSLAESYLATRSRSVKDEGEPFRAPHP